VAQAFQPVPKTIRFFYHFNFSKQFNNSAPLLQQLLEQGGRRSPFPPGAGCALAYFIELRSKGDVL